MIKQFNGVSESYNKGFDPVPVGCYVGRIDSVVIEQTQFGDVMKIALDIAEGDLAGYYKKRFAAESANDATAKFKGYYRVNIPVGDGTERDGWNINKFNRLLGAVSASNAGFKWNWNEQLLVGKFVGLVYREREWEFNGNTGFTTEIGMLCSVDDARKNKVKLKPRLLKKVTASANVVETTEEMPF